MSIEYSQRQLFGGAITCDIPASWRDVSIVRQVPYNQEVYQGLSENPNVLGPCFIVEVVEHQEVSNDEAAAYFFNDLAIANGVTSPEEVTFMSTPLPVSSAMLPNSAMCCSGIGMQMISHGRDVDIGGNPRLRNPHWVTVELCVLRLPHVGTDLLITLSQPKENPNEAGPYSFSQIFSHAVETFQVRDWNLFG